MSQLRSDLLHDLGVGVGVAVGFGVGVGCGVVVVLGVGVGVLVGLGVGVTVGVGVGAVATLILMPFDGSLWLPPLTTITVIVNVPAPKFAVRFLLHVPFELVVASPILLPLAYISIVLPLYAEPRGVNVSLICKEVSSMYKVEGTSILLIVVVVCGGTSIV